MSGPSAKRKSVRVLTTGSVGGGLTQKVKKPLSSVKLLSADKNLKDGGSVSVNGQLTSMNTDGEASDGKTTSDFQMNTPNVKCFNTGAAIGFPLGFINYDMDDEKEVSLPLCINGFGGATTLSKFEGIIKSTFTLSESMEKAVSLARDNNIIVNSDLKKLGIHSDLAIIIKKIPIDTPKKMIVAAVSEFGKMESIKIQLIGLWQKAVVEFAELEQAVSLAAKWSFLISKDSVCVAMAVGDHETWASKDQFRALLFTLPVRITAHDLGDLFEKASEKTCTINWSLETGNRVCYAVVCFNSDEILESAFHMEPIFGGVKLSWTRLDLVCYEWCRKFGHSALECDAELAKLYAKKNVPISCSVAFSGKSWAQVVSVASVSHGFHAGSGSGSPPSGVLSLDETPPFLPVVNSPLGACLALLKCSVELLSEQILDILSCLDNVGLAPLVPSSQMAPSVVVSQSPTFAPFVVANYNLDFDMAVDDPGVWSIFFSSGVADLLLGLSSSKVLTSKVGGLESKLVALDISVGLILAKLDQLCAGLGSSIISSS
ncbi:hypothetical protein G9A89_006028 [Geosiphon pyriformis]|nr:hypothetical protein G9A89_006028 [Geosiphon pyriformis]